MPRGKKQADLPTADLTSLFGDDPLFGTDLVAGVDEAGRGPLAGPVCAAAVILDPAKPIEGLNDSKKLSAKKRGALAPLIKERALAWAVAWASVEEIDRLNILQATMLAMTRAVEGLKVRPELILIDGNRTPKGLPAPASAVVKGDARVAAISAASILAKTERDRLMTELDETYPGYGFAQHAGYGTAAHVAAIRKLGVAPCHRRTFEPIKSLLLKGADND
ncbi:MAG: ribonuclease HII [Sutterella sp.]|nr:ribonuclease HII [Sutterella sp.]